MTIGGRPVQARVLRNDARMLDAAITVLSAQGWGGFNLNSVAHAMDMSERPVRNRARTKYDLAAKVWDGRLAADLEFLCRSVIDGYWRLQRTGDGEALHRALLGGLVTTPERIAAAELLTLATFNPELGAAVDATLGAQLNTRLAADEPHATRIALLQMLTLGLVLTRAGTVGKADVFAAPLQACVTACATPPAAAALPHVRVPEPVPADDPVLETLFDATVRVIGTGGFDGVTVRDIAAAVDRTEGFVFGHFASKLELLQAAQHAREAAAASWYARLQQVATNDHPGRAFALHLHHHLAPAAGEQRRFALETQRLAQRHATKPPAAPIGAGLHQALAQQGPWVTLQRPATAHTLHAVTHGATALAHFAPQTAASLGYASVTVPWFDALVSSSSAGE